MPMMGSGYPRWNGPRFQHSSITPLLGGLLVLSALNGTSYFFPPNDPLYPYYYGLWGNQYGGGLGGYGGYGGYGGGFGNPYGGYGIWSPWRPGFSLLGWLLSGLGGRRRRR